MAAKSLLFSLFFLGFPGLLAFADDHVSSAPSANQKETQIFYEEGLVKAAISDDNGDGRPDLFTYFKNGKRHSSESDADFDGQIDSWFFYAADGSLMINARDTNKDGRPDQFSQMLKGRNLVLREYDRNFDGKIDRRVLTQWDANKRLPIFENNRVQYIPVPGYVTLWNEEDNDFDGKVDVYTERGNKNPSRARIGQSIATPAQS